MFKAEELKHLPDDFVVFYCWQDHLDPDCHRYLIGEALRDAVKNLNKQIPPESKLKLRVDSDTSGRSGAVAIADTILEKIRGCQMVVADVTPTLKDEVAGRYYPNPNVMLELGYATRTIGWLPAICLFNNANGITPEMLPFDIRHRRLMQYTCLTKTDSKDATKRLSASVLGAIRSTLLDLSQGTTDPTLGNAAVKRARDLRLLREVMEAINVPALDRFIERAMTGGHEDDGGYYWIQFIYTVDRSGFQLHDLILKERIAVFRDDWGEIMNTGVFLFHPHPNFPGRWVLQPEGERSLEYSAYLERYIQAAARMRNSLRQLLEYVNGHYTELDTEETNAIAYASAKPYLAE